MAIHEDDWVRARRIKRGMNALRGVATDAQASRAIGGYPVMLYGGALIEAGTRIQWNGQLKRAATDLWDRPDNDPDHAPNLWDDIQYRAGYRIIPDPVTTALKFTMGEKGWWTDGLLYESLLEVNTWTPEQYPSGWRLVEP